VVIAVYRATTKWPKDEVFGLTAEVRQAAVASAVNICMGSVSRSSREFREFLRISLGKLTVLGYLLQLAGDLGYIQKELLGELEILRDHAGKLTGGLHRAVGKAAKDIKG
jgi:four helix bundle protein